VFIDRGFTQTEDVPFDKLDERWDFLRGTETSEFQSAYGNPGAGWCDAARATVSFMEAAERRGVKRVVGQVTELLLDTDSGRIEGVHTVDGQHLTADRKILAAGAWSSSLLSPIEDLLGIP
jgi:sarcosine oxidase/L-pipecolate oxidase